MMFKEMMARASLEKHKREQAETARKVALGVGIAAGALAAGVVTGILIAPRSGRQTRENLAKKTAGMADHVKAKMDQGAKAVKESVAHAAAEVRENIKENHGKAQDATKDIKEGIHEVKQDVRQTAQNVTDDLK